MMASYPELCPTWISVVVDHRSIHQATAELYAQLHIAHLHRARVHTVRVHQCTLTVQVCTVVRSPCTAYKVNDHKGEGTTGTDNSLNFKFSWADRQNVWLIFAEDLKLGI